MAIIDRVTRCRGIAYRLSLIQRDVPARWQIVANQSRRIEVTGLFHGLADLKLKTTVAGHRKIAGQEQVFPGSWRGIIAFSMIESQPPNAQDVRNKTRLLPVPDEQHGATGDLPLRFFDLDDFTGGEAKFRLEQSVGPQQTDKIDGRCVAKTHADRLAALSGARLVAKSLNGRPAFTAASGSANANPRGIGPHLIGFVFFARKNHRGEREPARARRPHQRWAAG